jgi:hypothetical protein
VTVYVVDGLFDVRNAEFGGRASVGLASGVACGLEDGINHGLFVAGLVAGRRAAPLVSGAAALYLSVHRTASPAEERAWLLDNATKGALLGNLHGSPNRLLFTGGPL